MDWYRSGKIANKDGTTITYSGKGTDITIESRKRHISHANGSGTWDHTTYFILRSGKELKECYTLKDAKEYAERMAAQ